MRGQAFGDKRQPQKRAGKGPRRGLQPEKTPPKAPAGGRKSVKNQIRSYQRLLNKVQDDPALKKSLEAKLQALQTEHHEHAQAALEQKLAKRYHKVKFFERVKIERAIQKLKREAVKTGTGSLRPEDASRLSQLEDDLLYVMHFPKGEKYVSLLRNANDPEGQAHLEAQRARLKAKVKEQLAERAMLAEVDEGRSSQQHAEGMIPQGLKEEAMQEGASEEDGESEEGDSENERPAGPKSEPAKASSPAAGVQAQTKRGQPSQVAAKPKSAKQRPPAVDTQRVAPGDAPAEPSERATQPFQDDFFMAADTDHEAAAQPAVLPAAVEEGSGKRKQTPQALAKRAHVHIKPAAPRQKPLAKLAKPKPSAPKAPGAVEKQPIRRRAEGGRKRRKKK